MVDFNRTNKSLACTIIEFQQASLKFEIDKIFNGFIFK